MIATVVYLVPFGVFGSEAANRFVDFSLEDPHEKKYSQSDMEGKITLVVLQSRTTLQNAVDCKTQLKSLPRIIKGTDDCNHGFEAKTFACSKICD